jgi:hypothetical protein
VETLSQHTLLSRLRERLSEAGMLDLAKRLIAIPSEIPPGNQKDYFAGAASDASSWSSAVSWAESDLDGYMRQEAANAPLFIELFTTHAKRCARHTRT